MWRHPFIVEYALGGSANMDATLDYFKVNSLMMESGTDI
jgi:hypothetical protein